MSREFAKLFWVDGIGQILVKQDTDAKDDIPEVRLYVQPEDMGVCSVALSFTDDEGGYSQARQLFDQIDEEMAEWLVRESIWDAAGGDE